MLIIPEGGPKVPAHGGRWPLTHNPIHPPGWPFIHVTHVVYERRQLEDVNSAIHEVETGQVKARLVFDLQ